METNNPIVNVAINGLPVEPFNVNFDIQSSAFHPWFGPFRYAQLSILSSPPITSVHLPHAINLFNKNIKTIIDRVFAQTPTINVLVINIENVVDQKLVAVRSLVKGQPHYVEHVFSIYSITGLMLENIIQTALDCARRFWFPESEARHAL